MNPIHFLAEQYLWEYHETFFGSAVRWIGYAVVYGGIALAVCAGIREAIRTSNNKPAPDRSQVAPVNQPGESTRAANPLVPSGTNPGFATAENSVLPANASRAVPDTSAGSADTRSGIAGPDVAERLRKLNQLREQGLISTEIYQAKREQILQTL